MDRKFRFSWRGLIPQIFILIILPLVALLLTVTFGGVALHKQAMRSLVGQRDERAVNAAASALTDQLNQRISDIRMLAASASGNSSPQAFNEILVKDDFLLASFDDGLAFLSADGQVLAATGNAEFWKSLNIQSDPELKNILNPASTPALYPSNPQGKSGVMFAAAPVNPGGPIAVGAFSPEVLIANTLNEVFNPGENGSAFVITQNHQLLFQTGANLDNVNLTTHPGVNAALAGNSGSTFFQAAGNEHVIAYSDIQPVGWALIIEEPWAAVASPLLRTTEYAPLVLIPVLLLALIALWFVTRRIIQPLQGLEAKANELAWGNYEAIEGSTGGIAEIRHLQTAMVHLAHKVKSYQQGLRGYIGAITMGQEEERRRLARELHDDTLQSMIALNQRVQLAQLAQNESVQIERIQSERVQSGSPHSEQAAQNGLAEIQSLTEQTIQNLRRLTRNLRPLYLEDLGLVAALEMLARETEQTSGIKVTFERSGTEIRLSPPVELALYRIGQETLSNVVRHAEATHAALQISYKPDSVILEIRDDGIGFDVPESPAEFAPSGHFGLLGIHERTEMIGAKLNIQSEPEQGTQVTVTVPRQPMEKRS
jgi:signal transduction histidine kinase